MTCPPATRAAVLCSILFVCSIPCVFSILFVCSILFALCVVFYSCAVHYSSHLPPGDEGGGVVEPTAEPRGPSHARHLGWHQLYFRKETLNFAPLARCCFKSQELSEIMVGEIVVVESPYEDLGWHYLSKATCLMRPHVFYACFLVSRYITTLLKKATFEESHF